MSWAGGFHTADRFGDVDRTYYPKDFSEDIRRYASVRGAECPKVDSGYAHPDYSVLEGPRLDYYLWWRECADQGMILLADSGYAWLRCCELINAEGDPRRALERIVAFTRTCSRSIRLIPLVSALAEEYALSRGLPLDLVPRGSPFRASEATLTWDLTRYPMREPDRGLLLSLAYYDWARAVSITPDQMAEIVFLSLSGIDEMVRSSEGRGLLRSIGCSAENETVWPLNGFADFSGKGRMDVPVVRISDEALRGTVDAVVRTAVRLSRDDGKTGPTVPKTFPQAYRRIVASAVDAVLSGDYWSVSMYRTSPGGFWEDDVPEPDDDGSAGAPAILPQVYPEAVMPTMSLRELQSNSGAESDADVPYVPSGRTMTSYSAMDADQRAFYTAWRTRARRGEYSDTDAGYLWLYCTELINSDGDPQEVQAELNRAAAAFYDAQPQVLMVAAADHAMLHGMDVPPEAIERRSGNYLAYIKLYVEPVGRMSLRLAEQYAGYDASRFVHGDPRVYSEAFTEAVRAVDSYMQSAKGRRIVDIGGTAYYYVTLRLYQGLWMPRHPVIRIDFRNVLGSKRVTDLMEGILKLTVRAINRRSGRLMPRAPELREEYARAASDAVEAYLDGRDSAARARRARDEAECIVIDPDAVRSAESDLEAVRGMMSVEEEGIEEEISVPEPAGPATGWDALAASLDAVERTYLVASLTSRGAGPHTLEGTGRRPSEVESSVNAKAMDAIGDAVMEEGRAFEEYAEDIRRMLG
ncbi:MAG: TerB N-terminal domain-containing protein [Thermoplasmata archaeon]|nr:TerB N-terminal domain-containing protein [Thermoplasmata archaeon]